MSIARATVHCSDRIATCSCSLQAKKLFLSSASSDLLVDDYETRFVQGESIVTFSRGTRRMVKKHENTTTSKQHSCV